MGTGSNGHQTRGCDHQTKEPVARPIKFQLGSGLTKVPAKKSKPLKSFTIRTEADLDKMLKTHPTIASMPANKEFRSELSALAPVSKKYVYVMMDSGASIHAAWMQKHFPGHFVRRSNGQKKGEFAHTAVPLGSRAPPPHPAVSNSCRLLP